MIWYFLGGGVSLVYAYLNPYITLWHDWYHSICYHNSSCIHNNWCCLWRTRVISTHQYRMAFDVGAGVFHFSEQVFFLSFGWKAVIAHNNQILVFLLAYRVCACVCVCVCNYGNPIQYIGTIKFVFMEFISGNNNCNHYSHSIVQPTSVVTTHWLYMWAGDAPPAGANWCSDRC